MSAANAHKAASQASRSAGLISVCVVEVGAVINTQA